MNIQKRTMRCAIYTRKSSEEGLEQEFNSLDAQHEACSAYIVSQKSEGWKLLSARYDDGGISGGTLERPALARLMADIDAGRIDLVVIYKIDRLTRSLTDFVKLVERFDKANCSFVSVTQSFNTATSMGRLTLNVLLSFAQFEREVTAERIRDKIAASKKKGIWMGGITSVGYVSKDRLLVVDPVEAADVRTIFRLFLELQNFRRLKEEVDRLGMWTRPSQTGQKKGKTFRYSEGHLRGILSNPIYVGDLRHKNQVHRGRHPPIIDRADFDRVQAILLSRSHRVRGQSRDGALKRAVLAGRLFDETGDRLNIVSVRNPKRAIRYFVSRRIASRSASRPDDRTGWRLSAIPLENAISSAIYDALAPSNPKHSTKMHALFVGSGDRQSQTADQNPLLELVETVRIAPGCLDITLQSDKLAGLLEVEVHEVPEALRSLKAPFHRRRRGVETKLIFGHQAPAVDPVLLKWVARGWVWWNEIRLGKSTLQDIAEREKVTTRFIAMHLDLGFLAPDIISDVIDGRHARFMNAQAVRNMQFPPRWADQRSLIAKRAVAEI